ncbi:MAG: hypothetical protein ABID63_18370 [Pseudomonadota bacterium]
MIGQIAYTALDDSPDDDGGWNVDGSGLCSINRFSRALAVWWLLQLRPQFVRDAVGVFNATSAVIHKAVEWRRSLTLVKGDDLIGMNHRFDLSLARSEISDTTLQDAIEIIVYGQMGGKMDARIPAGVIASILNIPRARVCSVVCDNCPCLYSPFEMHIRDGVIALERQK